MYSVHWGAHVVNGDTFQLQTFNNKYARDLPMTQASIAIQHLGHVGLWYLWQQQDTDLKARMLYGWLNGMRGIGSTKRNLLLNETYSETAARQYG
ncbi:hypothetical protein O0I10_013234 [Lichtheimia ornata]|uniref:Uncharacterized protein n=1 Tax=Lichtheimia ornata TaxID=688661 RepID=A0AAD7US54_9FUNG|nr:uncharacterized protein O0I10_013234 [Lichtheimia ornata]KAJ8651281.1 hypothetical protein O0I10_013234 [Lichtheimia ornata]